MRRVTANAAIVLLLSICTFSTYAQQHTQLINESVRLMGKGQFAEAVETGERAVKAAEEAKKRIIAGEIKVTDAMLQ